MTEWVKVNEELPLLDVPLLARTANDYGYGHVFEVFTFDGNMFTQEEAWMILINGAFQEWLKIPE
jgi:hypothetical protein